MSYFIWTTNTNFTKAQAKKINRECKKIDEEMIFVGPVDIPGNTTRGWLERPNDGTNDANFRRETSKQCIAIAKKVLGLED